MIHPDLWRQRREDMMREAEQARLAKALRVARKRPTNLGFLLLWELKRIAGHLLKFSERMGNGGRP